MLTTYPLTKAIDKVRDRLALLGAIATRKLTWHRQPHMDNICHFSTELVCGELRVQPPSYSDGGSGLQQFIIRL